MDQWIHDKLDALEKCLSEKDNVCGLEKVLQNIRNLEKVISRTSQDKECLEESICDCPVELTVGQHYATVANIEFQKQLTARNPHDIVLTFEGIDIVVEVKRQRKSARHDEVSRQLDSSRGLVEIKDEGEFSKLIRQITVEKYP